MKRLLLLLMIATAGCSLVQHRGDQNPYENPFYAKYLNTGSAVDAAINNTLAALRTNPNDPALHNQLGSLLVQKGFPKDAEREFERAVDLDGHFYPGWYNLGMVRASLDEPTGARFAFHRTVHVKPGHSQALFQLGLIEEKRGDKQKAIDYYAKAYTINPKLLEVGYNPRILDSKLTEVALLKMYPRVHEKESMSFIGTPQGYKAPTTESAPEKAPSPQAPANQIVPPAAPITDPGKQSAPPPTTPRP